MGIIKTQKPKKVEAQSSSATKRQILAVAMFLYYPLDFVLPAVLSARLIYNKVCDFLFIYMKFWNLKKQAKLNFNLHTQKKKTQQGALYSFTK